MKIFTGVGIAIELSVVGYLVALGWFPAPWPSTAAVILTGVNTAIVVGAERRSR